MAVKQESGALYGTAVDLRNRFSKNIAMIHASFDLLIVGEDVLVRGDLWFLNNGATLDIADHTVQTDI